MSILTGPIAGAAAGIGLKAAKDLGSDAIKQVGESFFKPAKIFTDKFMVIFDWIAGKLGVLAFIIAIALFVIFVGPRILVWIGGAANSQGIDSVQDVPDKIGEAATGIYNEATGQYEEDRATESGDLVNSEVEQNTKQNLGVKIESLELSQGSYKIDDPVSVWATITASTLNKEGMKITVSCNLVESGKENKKIIGTIFPQSEFNVRDKDDIQIKCDFAPGSLKEGSNQINVNLNYDFETISTLKASFMDSETLRTVKQTNPEILANIDLNPIAKNTDGPIAIGIGSSSFPIALGNSILPQLTISITNNWDGKIKNISFIEITLPDSIILSGCDSTKPLKKTKTENGLIYYQVETSGLENINSNIQNDKNTFVSENIRCLMTIDKTKMLSGNSLLTPIEKTITVKTNYNYETSEKEYVTVNENEGFIVKFLADHSPANEITKNSEIECVGQYYDGNIAYVNYILKLLRNGETIKETTEKSAYSQASNMYTTGKIDFEQIFGTKVEKEDSILCTMKMKPTADNKEMISSRYATIINSIPQIENVLFNPTYPKTTDDITCIANISDKDNDPITASYRIRINGIEEQNGFLECTLNSNKYVCSTKLTTKNLNENDRVNCEISGTDGTSTSAIKYSEVTLEKGVTQGSETISCTDSDSKEDFGIYKSYIGTVSGKNEDNVNVSLTDFCVNANTLREYYCDNGYVKYTDIDCSCYNGVC